MQRYAIVYAYITLCRCELTMFINLIYHIIQYLTQEHHLQRAICTGIIIPTPEVLETDQTFYDRNYPADYKMSRQMIHMQRK